MRRSRDSAPKRRVRVSLKMRMTMLGGAKAKKYHQERLNEVARRSKLALGD